MLEFDNIDKLFPSDVIKRAKEYLDAIPGGTGAYSDSQGASIIREQIAKVLPFSPSVLPYMPQQTCLARPSFRTFSHHCLCSAFSLAVHQTGTDSLDQAMQLIRSFPRRCQNRQVVTRVPPCRVSRRGTAA